MFGNVKTRQDFYPRDESAGGDPARRRQRPQNAIDAHANPKLVLARLDMNIGGAQGDGTIENLIECLHDRRAARQIAQAVGVVFANGRVFERRVDRIRLGRFAFEREFNVSESSDFQGD